MAVALASGALVGGVASGLLGAIAHTYSDVGNKIGGRIADTLGDGVRSAAKRLKLEEPDSHEQEQKPVTTPKTNAASEEAMPNAEEDDNGQLSTSVALVQTNIPGCVRYKPVFHTRVYRKKNRFFIDALNYGNAATNWTAQGVTGPLSHCIPWKCNAMYMDSNEMYHLHYTSARYRYKRAAFRFSNLTSHTGTLQGTGTTTLNFSYNGLLYYANIASRREIGPFSIVGASGTLKTYVDVNKDFSEPIRNEGYRNLDYHISLGTDIHEYTPQTSSVKFKLPNLIDMAYTRSSSMPISEFKHDIPLVWRTSFGSITPGTVRNPSTPQIAAYNDSMGNRKLPGPNSAMLIGAMQRNSYARGTTAENVFTEDIAPIPSRTQSAYGADPTQNADIEYHVKPDAFYFGFMVPNPSETDPHIYIGFELESEVEVEYEEFYPHYHAMAISNGFPLDGSNTLRNATWDINNISTAKATSLFYAATTFTQINGGVATPSLTHIAPPTQDPTAYVQSGLYGPEMNDVTAWVPSDGAVPLYNDQGWSTAY